MSYAVINTSCLFSYRLSFLSVLAVFYGLTVLEEQTPCICPLMCNFCVYSGSGEILVIFLVFMSGQVI